MRNAAMHTQYRSSFAKRTEIIGRESEVRSQESEVRDQISEIRGRKSLVKFVPVKQEMSRFHRINFAPSSSKNLSGPRRIGIYATLQQAEVRGLETIRNMPCGQGV